MSQHSRWVSEAAASAMVFDHEWDHKAIDWPLDESNLVVEVGGFKGRWALQIAQLYNPRLFVFEPQPWAAAVCREVLAFYNAAVYECALGDHTGLVMLGQEGTDGASLFEASRQKSVVMREASEMLGGYDIDLMLVNIEGYEYVLVPYLVTNNIKPRRLMIQFHTKFDNGGQTEALRKMLAAVGYDIVWDYGDRLAAWELGQ